MPDEKTDCKDSKLERMSICRCENVKDCKYISGENECSWLRKDIQIGKWYHCSRPPDEREAKKTD